MKTVASLEGEAFLAHYGVLGMKWGVRKDDKPPTAAEKAEREKAAKKFDTRVSGYNKTLKKLETTPQTFFNRRGIKNEIKSVTKLRDQAVKDAQAKRDGILTDDQKKLVIGAAIVGGLVAASLIRGRLESGAVTKLVNQGKAFIKTGAKYQFARNAKLADKMGVDDIMENVVKKVNPGYGQIGTKMNCRRATFAYEMRRRGFDVQATRTTNGYGQNVMGLDNALNPGIRNRGTNKYAAGFNIGKEQYRKAQNPAVSTPLTNMGLLSPGGGKNSINLPGPTTSLKDFFGTSSIPNGGKEARAQAIFDVLNKQPNGSRGEIGVTWASGGGHSIAYEIINGKAVVFDNQIGKKYENVAEWIATNPDISKAGFTRLDDLDLDFDYLMRWVQNVKS